MYPSIQRALALSGLVAALAPATSAQGDCKRPGLDVVPGFHPYGPVDPEDGVTDHIAAPTHVKLALQFSVPGLDHAGSLPHGQDFLTFGLFAPAPSEVPFPLAACAELALPYDALVMPVPGDSLELGVQVDAIVPPGESLSVWAQTLSVDLLDPGLALATSDPARIWLQRGPISEDPATRAVLDCTFVSEETWNDGYGDVLARIWWGNPCDGTDAPSWGSHVLILCPEAGQPQTAFDDLAEHLARNRYIVAVLDPGTTLDPDFQAERMRTVRTFLRDHWEHEESVQLGVNLMGHGRNAEAAILAAEKLDQDVPSSVGSVVLLAPTDEGYLGQPLSVEGDVADRLLVIAGSKDEVVSGYCVEGTAPDCGQPIAGPQATGFAIYDRSGHELSSYGSGTDPLRFEKAMLFVEGADHGRWGQPCSDPPPFLVDPPLDCELSRTLLRGYVSAFLFSGAYIGFYGGYLDGSLELLAAEAAGVRVLRQYSDHRPRRMLHNFEQALPEDGLHCSLAWSDLDHLGWGPAWIAWNHTSPHDTRQLHVGWDRDVHPEPELVFTIDDELDEVGFPLRDLGPKTFFSMRVGQVWGAPRATPGQATDFTVVLRDENGQESPAVFAGELGDLSYPHGAAVVDDDGFTRKVPKSSMRTVRIPLELFTGVDRSAIQDVVLRFDAGLHPRGEVILDSVEIVH